MIYNQQSRISKSYRNSNDRENIHLAIMRYYTAFMLEKAFHHEGHEEHEGKTANYDRLRYKKLHLLGVREFLDNTLKLFVNFVIFVVRLPNLGLCMSDYFNTERSYR